MRLLSSFIQRAVGHARTRLYRPQIAVTSGGRLVRLGSDYGGWTVLDTPELYASHLISAGLGEDASFDVEMAARFNATVVVVDPTPRAIAHFEAIEERLGMPATGDYIAGGRQPVESYDLAKVAKAQLSLVPKALWISAEPVRFHEPGNPDHVSHSIKFSSPDVNAGSIMVPTVQVGELLSQVSQGTAVVLKMDIEGAEVEVLQALPSWPRLPSQILIEFDVLRQPGKASKLEVERIDRLLAAHGYSCRHFDGMRNYLYVR